MQSKKPKLKLFTEDENSFVQSVCYERDGRKLVTFRDTGRVIEVPAGIRLFLPNESFYDTLVRDTADGLDEAGIPLCVDVVKGKLDKRLYKILVAQAANTIWVTANAPGDQYVVCAQFSDEGTHLQEVRAAAKPECCGQGVYRQILKALRRHFKTPLVSDDTLSPQNVLVWSGVGKYSGKGYRINPRRKITAADVRAVLALAASEVALGERLACW